MDCFIELDHSQQARHSRPVSGDVFLCRRLSDGDRAIAVLADGLGSGIEAAAVASLTASMAVQYVASDIDVFRSAETIMDILPIDDDRRISYSTFSLADIRTDGRVRVMEHGNPPFMLVREGRCVEPGGRVIAQKHWGDRSLRYAELDARPGDRIVFLSDGVTQSGMGRPEYPFGWTREAARDFICGAVAGNPDISARLLSRLVVSEAFANDGRRAGDDITCGVIYFRMPRRLLVVSGPPFRREKDAEVARRIADRPGRAVICGGTTANIVGRELGREVTTDLSYTDPEVPAPGVMEGVDLITEGMLTLSRVAELLEGGGRPPRTNAATLFAEMLLESDAIEFVVGTGINPAHQDPSLPVELDIRRNVVKRIAGVLERNYLKRVSLEFI